MIIVISYKDKITGKTHISHGIDTETNETVILPQDQLPNSYTIFDMEIGEYILKE